MKTKRQHHVIVGILSLCTIALLGGCGPEEPIKIGFSGCLTGRFSDMGTAGRDSVILAVEQLNKAGGIHGRRVELLIKDDQQDAAVAVKVDQELIDEGVVAIIGHITSSMTLAALPVVNQAKMLLLSSNASSSELSGRDDYFFRVCPDNEAQTRYLAEYTARTLEVQRLAVLYDLSNQAYTEGIYTVFKAAFEETGGTVVSTQTFVSGQDVSYLNIITDLLDANPDGILISAGALDTAMLCQQLEKLNADVPVVASGWALTNDLLIHGGTAIEGIVFSHSLDEMSQEKRFLAFQQDFRDHFGKDPNPAAIFSYEAAQLLFTALADDKDQKDLKQTILNIQRFQGSQGEIAIDPYGDVQRKFFIVTVKDGAFITVE